MCTMQRFTDLQINKETELWIQEINKLDFFKLATMQLIK